MVLKEKKREYIDMMDARLTELDDEIRELRDTADKAVIALKVDYRKQVNALFLKKEALKHEVNQIKEVGGNAWEDIKAGVELSWEALNESVKNGFRKPEQ